MTLKMFNKKQLEQKPIRVPLEIIVEEDSGDFSVIAKQGKQKIGVYDLEVKRDPQLNLSGYVYTSERSTKERSYCVNDLVLRMTGIIQTMANQERTPITHNEGFTDFFAMKKLKETFHRHGYITTGPLEMSRTYNPTNN